MPELSFGSHMFQDLVEANILYIACMENAKTITYQPKLLQGAKEMGAGLLAESVRNVIQVYDTSACGWTLCMDAMSGEVICAKE